MQVACNPGSGLGGAFGKCDEIYETLFDVIDVLPGSNDDDG